MRPRRGRWAVVLVGLLALIATLTGLPSGAARAAATNPDASVSDRNARPVHAERGPRGATGREGTGAPRRRAVEAPAIGPFRGPVLGDRLVPDPLAQSLVGYDTRSEVVDSAADPARMVALITFNGNQWCTGFLIGPDTVATAGHCVHPGGGGAWYSAPGFRVYPGYDANRPNPAPFGSCGAWELYATAGWTAGGSDEHDYGAIKLDCTIGYQTGWFGWWWQPKSLDGQITKVFGYPGDKAQQAWKSKDYVRVTEARRVFYANDTVGGNSGSPVFRMRGASEVGCQGPCVLAIHAYGVYGAWPTGAYNHGTRITQEVSDNLLLWRDA